MTDYSQMDHQKLYDYVHSGSPDSMNGTAQAWQSHSQALEEATSQLQSNLTAIQSQWQGAAADAYFQQSEAVAAKMQTHADNAANTGTAVTNTASALSWARSNMPDPPSWLEQQTANIDSNIVSGAIGFLSTGGAATAASEIAKRDIANKHQQAISIMTQLAGAYTSAKAQLPQPANYDDPTNGNGNGNGGDPTVMPVPVYPVGGTGGGAGDGGYSGGGAWSGGHTSGGAGGGVGGGFGSGTGGGSTGGGSGVEVPSYPDPGGSTFTQGAGGTGSTTGGLGGSPNPYGPNQYGAAGGSAGGSGTAGQFGGASGAAGAFGSGGYGGSGRSGTGRGGTDLGGGEGSGAGVGGRRGGANGRFGSAAATAGEGESMIGGAAAEGEGRGQSGAMMGGMGGRGGAGGGSEERGNRAGYLRQDPDYWYGDKQAAPPGGVIE